MKHSSTTKITEEMFDKKITTYIREKYVIITLDILKKHMEILQAITVLVSSIQACGYAYANVIQ